MEETNITGLTMEQRINLMNINQDKSTWELAQPLVHSVVWTIYMGIIIFGSFFILSSFYKWYKANHSNKT